MSSAIKLEQFGGMLPAWNPHVIPPNQAQDSLNGYLFSGVLTGWRAPKLLRTLTNSAATFVYRVPVITQGTATSNLLFVTNAIAGDAVKVGEEIYTFTATVTNAYDVLLGATATASRDNMFAAITFGAGLGTIYGTGTCPNLAVDQTGTKNAKYTNTLGSYPAIIIYAPEFGAAFNTTVTTENTSAARLTWLGDPSSLVNVTTHMVGGVNQTFDNQITGTAKWMEFEDPDTTVMRSPVVDDRFGRYYFSSPSLPPKYNTYDRIQNDQTPWLLGVPAPGCAPGVTITSGGDAAQLGFPNSIVAGVGNPGSNKIYVVPVTPTAAMQLNDVSFMPSDTNATARFAAVLFDDNAGVPFQLLNSGEIIDGCIADTQVTSQFVNPTGLLAGVKYWLGFMTDSVVNLHFADATTVGAQFSNTFSNGPPTFASGVSSNAQTYQVWGNLTTSSIIAARSYVYTWVTEYDEEGPPSPNTLVNGWSNGVWTLSLFTPPSDDMGVVRNITKKRIYRTVTAAGGSTTYFFVAEVPVLQNTYVDVIDDSIIALNNQLPSVTWFPPPEGVYGIVSMPNGMAVGFRGNEIWFAEPYQPHAWPPNYVITTEFPIVGIGVTGQSVVAATSGTPYVATGVNPNSMTLTKTVAPEPCASRGSVLGTDDGVYYASPNGLILVTGYGKVANTTALWITRERWRELTPLKFGRAILLSSCYFSFGTVFNGDTTYSKMGFTIELSTDDAQSFTIWPQPGGHRIGFQRMASPLGFDIKNVQVDAWTGIGLLIHNGGVYYYDFQDQAPTITTYKWRSKTFHQTTRKNFEAMRVFFDVPPGAAAQSATRQTLPFDDPTWNTLGAGQYGIIRVFADDNLVTVREIRSSGELMRIVSGFKYEFWMFEIEARVKIINVQIATSVKELSNL